MSEISIWTLGYGGKVLNQYSWEY